jgi:hypothetical protein
MQSRGVSVNTPEHVAAYAFQLALARSAQRDFETAIEHFQAAERLGYDANACSSNRWHAWMKLGDFEKAWRESDGIAWRGGSDPHSFWDGLPFGGKRVIIRCLHGYGDAIQFLRYASMIRQTASRVIVETHPEMVRVLRGMAGVDAVTSWGPVEGSGHEHLDTDWDQQIEVMELARAFRTTLATIPARIPYLQVGDAARRLSCVRLGESGKPRVGLVWASSAWNPARSVPPDALSPLLNVDGCSFYSFQRGPEREAIQRFPPGCRIHDTCPHSPDIADTAADLTNMDLLITVDTMAAHLAGALGRTVWVMLPWDADWRWMLDREDSPWYPTMQLYRQPSPGDWKPVVRRIAEQLRGL